MSYYQKLTQSLKTLQQNWHHHWQTLDPSHHWQHDHIQKSHHTNHIYHLENGHIFEKACINYSVLQGDELPQSALPKHMNLSAVGKPFAATGISTILHPQNPFVPIAHANLRYFTSLTEPYIWWYGAVIDLNPCYGFVEDCIAWHQGCQQACQRVNFDQYPVFKKACDDYFYLPHRQEHRGIGGLWVEYLNTPNQDACESLLWSIAQHFITSYSSIVAKRHPLPFQPRHKNFQQLRRARYAEFNLLHDRGTQFGLKWGGRTESILASMPPCAKWQYIPSNRLQQNDEKALSFFLKPKNWADMSLNTTPA
ncbi:MAG: oxygen-dependent coproporphyrinogen oxidase [Pseudomonadota bacterium]|nr:oxygen-dependent coproporphyrinogen oxidase [Pseudomonadota bacterium]